MSFIDGKYKSIAEKPWRFGAIVLAQEREGGEEVTLARVDESVFADEAERDAFVAGMDMSLAIRHASVMYLDRVFVAGGAVWLVGDAPRGKRLAEVLEGGRSGGRAVMLEDARRWLAQVSSALGQLQDRGVVAVDLDEDSVWITGEGARLVFPGVASALDRRALLAQAGKSSRLEALAPEVRAGDKLDLRGDVYSFGRFAGLLLSAAKVARADVATVLLRAQDPDPHARYASSERFRQELEAVLVSPSAEGDPVTPAIGVDMPKEAWHTGPTKPVDPDVLRRLQDQEITREVPRSEIVPLIQQSSTTEQIDADMIVPPEPGEAGRDELDLQSPVPRIPDPETVPGKRAPEPDAPEPDTAIDVLPTGDLPVPQRMEPDPEPTPTPTPTEVETTPTPPTRVAAAALPAPAPAPPLVIPPPSAAQSAHAPPKPKESSAPRPVPQRPAAPPSSMWVWFVVVALVLSTGTALYILHVYNQQHALVEHEQKRQMAEELKAQADELRRQKAPPSQP